MLYNQEKKSFIQKIKLKPHATVIVCSEVCDVRFQANFLIKRVNYLLRLPKQTF